MYHSSALQQDQGLKVEESSNINILEGSTRSCVQPMGCTERQIYYDWKIQHIVSPGAGEQCAESIFPLQAWTSYFPYQGTEESMSSLSLMTWMLLEASHMIYTRAEMISKGYRSVVENMVGRSCISKRDSNLSSVLHWNYPCLPGSSE